MGGVAAPPKVDENQVGTNLPKFAIFMLAQREERSNMYFRVGNRNENILEATSVEVAVELHGFEDADDLLVSLGFDGPEDGETESLFWDEDGHFGAGFYYAGVCCTESLDALADYFSTAVLGTNALKDAVVFVFEGEWLDSCNDGEVVNPTKLLAILDPEILN